jgi:pimeloyl-ACP methyl ester carboxylesterase
VTAALPGDQEDLERVKSRGYQLPDEDDAGRYPGPACLITGRPDQVAGYADQFRVLGTFPAASYSVVAEAGHYLPFERPGPFRAIAGEWLDGCVTAGP